MHLKKLIILPDAKFDNRHEVAGFFDDCVMILSLQKENLAVDQSRRSLETSVLLQEH